MTAGIDDVARAAGVSTATVSRALRDLPNVNPSTRERVRRAAAELGYVASPSASRLASGRTSTIGVISPWVNRWFFAEIIDGAERALRARGYDVLLYTFAIERDGERPRVDPDVLRRRVDGIVVVGLPLDVDELEALRGLGYPTVLVGWGGEQESTVRLDDRRIGREATEHLIGLGHTVIAHLTGTPDPVHAWAPPGEREKGWREALAEAGLDGEGLVQRGGFDVAGARESAEELLTRRPDVTAVFAASDEMAMGVILAMRDRGLRAPEDLSVIGVDGHELGELVDLTTMAQSVHEQGSAAADLVLAMIDGRGVAQQMVFPARLLRRGSTGPPRTGPLPTTEG